MHNLQNHLMLRDHIFRRLLFCLDRSLSQVLKLWSHSDIQLAERTMSETLIKFALLYHLLIV